MFREYLSNHPKKAYRRLLRRILRKSGRDNESVVNHCDPVIEETKEVDTMIEESEMKEEDHSKGRKRMSKEGIVNEEGTRRSVRKRKQSVRLRDLDR